MKNAVGIGALELLRFDSAATVVAAAAAGGRRPLFVVASPFPRSSIRFFPDDGSVETAVPAGKEGRRKKKDGSIKEGTRRKEGRKEGEKEGRKEGERQGWA